MINLNLFLNIFEFALIYFSIHCKLQLLIRNIFVLTIYLRKSKLLYYHIYYLL